MTLQAKLDEIRAGFEQEAPDDAKRIMHEATDRLRASGIMDRLPTVGDDAADFVRCDADNIEHDTRQLREDGPLVLSFYRGRW